MHVSRVCQISKQPFIISDAEQERGASFGLPLPVISPEERFRQRLAFVNERNFYWRDCSVTGERLFSVYPESAPFPVVGGEAWAEGAAGHLRFGRDYDTERGFFEQLYDLWRVVPRPDRTVAHVSASPAVELGLFSANSFLLAHAFYVEDCLYSAYLTDAYRCCDCLHSTRLTRCYECIDCHRSELLRWCEHCADCRDSWFLFNCRNCSHCLFCTDLDGKEYHVFNTPVSPEEYGRALAEWQLNARPMVENARNRFTEFLGESAGPRFFTDNRASGTGNSLYGCGGIERSFHCVDSTDLIHCDSLFRADNCLSGLGFGDGLESSAQFVSVGLDAVRIVNCVECFDRVSDLTYCIGCRESSNLFGCIGLVGREYCILNRQYSKSRYLELRETIENQLQEAGRWGIFFPVAFTPFAYNHSAAHDYMPLNETQAAILGYSWSEDSALRPSELLRSGGSEETFADLPLTTAEGTDALSARVFLCEITGKPFRWSKREIALYDELGVAPPARSFEQRHRERVARMLAYLDRQG